MPTKSDRALTDLFLHELALLMLAETPIKSTVRNRAKMVQAEIYFSIEPNRREAYLKSRDALLLVVSQFSKCDRPEQVIGLIKTISKGLALGNDGNENQ